MGIMYWLNNNWKLFIIMYSSLKYINELFFHNAHVYGNYLCSVTTHHKWLIKNLIKCFIIDVSMFQIIIIKKKRLKHIFEYVYFNSSKKSFWNMNIKITKSDWFDWFQQENRWKNYNHFIVISGDQHYT